MVCVGSVREYLAQHAAAHAAHDLPRVQPEERTCYTCVLARAERLRSLGIVSAIGPNAHGLWSGDAWSSEGPSSGGAPTPSLKRLFPQERQQDAAEYLESIFLRFDEVDDALQHAHASGVAQPRAPLTVEEVETRQGDCVSCELGAIELPRSAEQAHIIRVNLPQSESALDLNELLSQSQISEKNGPCGLGEPPCQGHCGFLTIRRSWELIPGAEAGALCVVLTRFAGQDAKCTSHVRLPDSVNVAGRRWVVSSAVQHVGASITNGHYVALVKDSTGGYRLCNDDCVSESMTLAQGWSEISCEPYILFFTPE